MESLYNFINLLKNCNVNYFEDSKIFSMEFNNNEVTGDLIKFKTIKNLKSEFPKHLNIYISSNAIDEIDLMEFLDDEDEFKEEVNIFFNKESKYKLTFDKNKYVEDKFGNLSIISNIYLYVLENEFVKLFNLTYQQMETEVFKELKKNIFILGCSDTFFYNNFYMVTNIKQQKLIEEISNFINNRNVVDTRKLIQQRNELCNWIDGSHYLTPNSFHIDFNNLDFKSSEKIMKTILKKNTDLIIPFISNFTGNVDEKYVSVINGSKRIEIEFNLDGLDYKLEQYNALYKLYNWIYEDLTFDKIIICRNVISILIAAKCNSHCKVEKYKIILENGKWLLISVQDNFEKFLQGNISDYFKEKNKLVEQIKKDILGLSSQITELTKIMNTNITSLLGIAIAGVVGYIAKGETSLVKILAILYVIQLDINFVFNVPIVFIRFIQSILDLRFEKDMYIKYYTEDEQIKRILKKNKFNITVFIIYFIFTIILTVILNYFMVKLISNDLFLQKILEIFKAI